MRPVRFRPSPPSNKLDAKWSPTLTLIHHCREETILATSPTFAWAAKRFKSPYVLSQTRCRAVQPGDVPRPSSVPNRKAINLARGQLATLFKHDSSHSLR